MITSASNRIVKLVRALQSRRSARREEGLFVVEGVRLAYEVVAQGLPVQFVFHTDNLSERGKGLVNTLARQGADVHVVSEGVMKTASSTESPSGILLALPVPELSAPDMLSLVLIIDKLADPGNMGTILRTAYAAGVQAVLLTKGTVDPFNPKVVRAAMGAHLRLPIRYLDDVGVQDWLEGLDIWLAERGVGSAYYDVDWRSPVALVIGSESHGPGDTLRSLATGEVYVPVKEETESLNAAIATGVILFEIARQRETLTNTTA